MLINVVWLDPTNGCITGAKPGKTKGKRPHHRGSGSCSGQLHRLGLAATVAMPRIRDFRGLNPKSFDGRGNYAMGLKEHIVFPEIEYDKIEQMWGMDIVFATTARTDAEARALLKHFNMPFRA